MSISAAKRAPARPRTALPASRLSAPAGVAVATTALFIALTAWWLSQDHGTPYGDAAEDLQQVLAYRHLLAEGDPLAVFRTNILYPPLTYVVGAIATLVGGVSIPAAVLGQNLVYVPLLALGCYRTGRLAFGPRAGAAAVAMALGAPLIAEQFHVFMLDAPLAALVAVAVWLVLESRRFSRPGVAAAAGVAVGLGVESKEYFVVYLAGLLAVVLLRGGWRNWRGLALFAATAAAVGAPWYLDHLGQLHAILNAAGPGGQVPPNARPALLSTANFAWYAWALLNGLLFAPLFAFALVGIAVAAVGLARRREARSGPVPELLGGLGGAWLLLLLMPHHDLRYSESMIVYLAVLGTGWLVGLRAPWWQLGAGALALAVTATTLGATFGLGGGYTHVRLPGNRSGAFGEGVPPRDRIVVYAPRDFLVAGPRRGPDVLAVLRALKAQGVQQIAIQTHEAPLSNPDFNFEGVTTLAQIAGLQRLLNTMPVGPTPTAVLTRRYADGSAPPCLRFPDGSGLWIHVEPSGERFTCPVRAG